METTNQDHAAAVADQPVTASPYHPVIALLGNPNTGKTTLFNALSGLRQRTGNYPGVTVETKKGQFSVNGRGFDLIDLPGTYSLAPRSPDEMVAVDVILGRQEGERRPDVVVSIVDASNLERNLYLTTQALELGVPVVVALNMIDVAESRGVKIDTERLSQQTGLPVVPIQANKGKNLAKLKETIAALAESRSRFRAPAVPFPEPFEREAAALREVVGPEVPDYIVRRLLLDVGGYAEERLSRRQGDHIRQEIQKARQRLQEAGCPVPAVEARARYGWIREATAGCVQRPTQRPVTWTDRLDRILTHRLWGSLVFLALMFAVFQSIFTLATPLMDWIDGGMSALQDAIRTGLPQGMFTSLLADGVVAGVGGILVFLPQILILFAFIAVLEDCGYMARAAFLMDKVMARAGLSGKSFIPMLSSVACAIPGIMATRVIENRRDRLATILVAPLMSCSARLPVYVLLIGAFLTTGFPWWVPGVAMFSMYALGLVLAPLVAWALKRTLLRGATPVFVMEMPSYKVPSPKLVARRMYDSGWAFVYRAGTLILASMILVWALLYFPHKDADGVPYEQRVAELEEAGEDEKANKLQEHWKEQSILGRMGKGIEPAVEPLGWDWRLGVATLASFPAREVVVGTLGIIYELGEVDPGEIEEAEDAGKTELGVALQNATWDEGSKRAGQKVFTVPVALSLMVFFALCCQCASTLAVIKRETRSWGWPLLTFVYMTVLAYVVALAVYQVGTRFFA